MGFEEVSAMRKLVMRHGMVAVALGSLLAEMAMGQEAPASPARQTAQATPAAPATQPSNPSTAPT